MRRKPEQCVGGGALPSDEDIVAGIARRNHAALKELIDRHASRVLSVCLRISIDRSDAESVMSDVFWEFWNRHSRFDPARGSLASYLLVLARSRSVDRRRMRVTREVRATKFVSEASADASLLVDGHTGEKATLQSEEKRLLHGELKALPEAQQRVLRLVFFAGCSHVEAAEQLAMPLGTVKSHVRRGLLQMRRGLADRYES